MAVPESCGLRRERAQQPRKTAGWIVLQKLGASSLAGADPAHPPSLPSPPALPASLEALRTAVECWPVPALLCALPDGDLPLQVIASSPEAHKLFMTTPAGLRGALDPPARHALAAGLRALRARLSNGMHEGSEAAPASVLLTVEDWLIHGSRIDGEDAAFILLTFLDRQGDDRQGDASGRHDGRSQDALTGLLDRDGFLAALEAALQPVRQEGEETAARAECAVVVINLDRFQRVNESFGHARGDSVLAGIAQRLAALASDSLAIGRLNGDEFAVLLKAHGDVVAAARSWAERFLELIETPFSIAEEEVHLSACIGIATTATGSRHPTDLLRDADVAVHRAKARGRGQIELYVRERRVLPLSPLQLEAALRRALRTGEGLTLAYQPIVELDTSRIIGFEALARWLHPSLGPIPPGEFIPIAEDAGLIDDLGEWALDEACATLAEWRRKFASARRLSVSVNVSGHQFQDPGFARRVCDRIARHGLEGAAVRLEITESVLIQDPALAAETLTALNGDGVLIALDDFGTGYSSLNYLHRFPISFVKIDRSFCLDLEQEPERQRLIKGLAALADTLGLVLVAEGIERHAQQNLLRRLGCRLGQGYHFSRPLPAAEALALYMREERDAPPRRTSAAS